MLEFAVTDVESGERMASFPPKPVSLFAIENLSGIKEVSADLLGQLGVNLTTRGRQEIIRATSTASMQAEMALARGITAQRQGTEVEALSYFIQARNLDAGLTEATSRMNILAADISSGNIGIDARNEIAWRRQWIERLQEAENLFSSTIRNPQPFYIVYSTNIQRGAINFQRETIELSIDMSFFPDFSWANQINEVIRTVSDGLKATGRADTWGLDWPAISIETPSPFTTQAKNLTSTVVVEIINEQGRSIGRQTVTSPYGFLIANQTIFPLWQWEGTVTFPAVDANMITDRLNIRITSIDGNPAETVARERMISVMPQSEWEQEPAKRVVDQARREWNRVRTEEITLSDWGNRRLTYTLSNNLNSIEQAISTRASQIVDLNNVTWRVNTALSADVRNLMNQHNVNYSMTTYIDGESRVITVNRRTGNQC